ncbi:putative ATP-dependent helicase Lhr [Symmachiella macrocystis]|uniref:Putative ATP-dependent helicase Lhr n=2 Tax=Symmachiella macrocystis TaxID=2527985 RepID=A0A5C6BJ03_9PLAN|nr:putative ATP-dependent helicase Lhr [Symmachiella macrocystis]
MHEIMSTLHNFHPLIQQWFRSRFAAPTEPQQRGWPFIADGQHTLIAAPTGSGKTLTAFLAAIDRLLKLALAGELEQRMYVVYVSPLRALSNDMHRNLEDPLNEIMALATENGIDVPPIRVGLRTGDTKSSQRAALVRKPPHILVTTPESLYLMLTAEKSREKLKAVETVIVDEIHALVRDKRGSHLSLTLERLQSWCERPFQRVGLSATQRPIEYTARFLVGFHGPNAGQLPCEIIDVGHQRELDLAIEVPPSELGAVCMHEQWAEVNERIAELINNHRSTLIFVNTRRMAERITHLLTKLMGEDAVSSHHGSLAAKFRLETEQRLKEGKLKAVVATASLELGIDIGYIDLVIQIGSPRSIATFLQRVGRSGHSLGLIPKGRLFALTRDELYECMALLRAVRGGRLDRIPIPTAPLDILAQQIVAEVSAEEWGTDDLFAAFRRAAPYHELSRTDFDKVVEFLSEGVAHANGRSRVFLHHDQVNRRIRPRPGARLAATMNGGAIGEVASYRVIAEPERTVVGTLDEEFAAESQAGDIFLLGNTSWRIQHVRGGEVTVFDAHGAPPSIPFWRGEAPGRTLELSEEVSRLREELEPLLDDEAAAQQWLIGETDITPAAAEQAVTYAAAQKAALGLLPTCKRVVFERFFDESGGMQMLIHAPFGGRINTAWGMSLRKRFCRSFDFELQATADDNGLILSLGPQHSFPLESMFGMLNPNNARHLLEQALLAVPTFQIRWRWNVTRSLLVARMNNGKKVPPPLQRFRADDLLTAVFPKLTGCQENITGDHEIPDHPLIRQTMEDCLFEAMDIAGLENVLTGVQRGDITYVARDTREPSPFCYELLNASPYAFLDGGEFVERRARMVATRRSLTVDSVSDLGRLDPLAISQVRDEATPTVRDADELHDALLGRILLPVNEAADWSPHYLELQTDGRATTVTQPDGRRAWVATERLPAVLATFDDIDVAPPVTVPENVRQEWESTEARVAIVRGLMEMCGPISVEEVAERTWTALNQAAAALEALEGEGVVLQGHFTPACYDEKSDDPQPSQDVQREWCHRRLLSRIHRLTLQGLRKQIEPVSVDIFIRHLTRHQQVLPETRRTGSDALFDAIAQLQGMDVPAVAWERDVLSARVENYQPAWLDELCMTGEIGWGRLYPPRRDPQRSRPMVSLTKIARMSLFLRSDADWLSTSSAAVDVDELTTPAQQVLECLTERGAMFAGDLAAANHMLPGQLAETLGELVASGLVTADGFDGIRQFVANKPAASNSALPARMRRGAGRRRLPVKSTGRWSVWERDSETSLSVEETNEQWAWQLLRRWGVIFRDLLQREQGAPRWFELLQVYRRLEARGEIRGGRFIAGVGGEQFALGDTVNQLRQLRDDGPRQELIVLSATDPLNLIGILTDHPRVPSTASNRIVYLDGMPVASLQAGVVEYLDDCPPAAYTLVASRLQDDVTCDLSHDARQRSLERLENKNAESAAQRVRQRREKNGFQRPRVI